MRNNTLNKNYRVVVVLCSQSDCYAWYQNSKHKHIRFAVHLTYKLLPIWFSNWFDAIALFSLVIVIATITYWILKREIAFFAQFSLEFCLLSFKLHVFIYRNSHVIFLHPTFFQAFALSFILFFFFGVKIIFNITIIQEVNM